MPYKQAAVKAKLLEILKGIRLGSQHIANNAINNELKPLAEKITRNPLKSIAIGTAAPLAALGITDNVRRKENRLLAAIRNAGTSYSEDFKKKPLVVQSAHKRDLNTLTAKQLIQLGKEQGIPDPEIFSAIKDSGLA